MDSNVSNPNDNYQQNYNQNEQFFNNEPEPSNVKPAEPIIEQPQPEIVAKNISNPYNEPKEEFNQDDDTTINYMIRRGFIIKTYGILISQLIITCIFICLSFVP